MPNRGKPGKKFGGKTGARVRSVKGDVRRVAKQNEEAATKYGLKSKDMEVVKKEWDEKVKCPYWEVLPLKEAILKLSNTLKTYNKNPKPVDQNILDNLPPTINMERIYETISKLSPETMENLKPSHLGLYPSDLGFKEGLLPEGLLWDSGKRDRMITYAVTVCQEEVKEGRVIEEIAGDKAFACQLTDPSEAGKEGGARWLVFGIPDFFKWENGFFHKKWANILEHKPKPSCDRSPTRFLVKDQVQSFHLGIWAQQGNYHGVTSETLKQSKPVVELFKDLFNALRVHVVKRIESAIKVSEPLYWERMVHLYRWRCKAFPDLYGEGKPWDLGPLFTVCAIRFGDTPRTHLDHSDISFCYNFIVTDGDFGDINIVFDQINVQVPIKAKGFYGTRSGLLRHCTTRLSPEEQCKRLMMSLFIGHRDFPEFAREGLYSWDLKEAQKTLDGLEPGFGYEVGNPYFKRTKE